MSEYDNIGKFVKEQLEGHQEQPSGQVWQSLEKQLPSAPAASGFKWWYAVAGTVVVAAAVYFFAFSSGDDVSTEKVHKKPDTEIVQQAKPEKENNEQKSLIVEEKTEQSQSAQAVQNNSTPESPVRQKKDISEMKVTDDGSTESPDVNTIKSREPGINTPQNVAEGGEIVVQNDTPVSMNPDPVFDGNEDDNAGKARAVVFSENPEICAGEKVTLWASGGVAYEWSTGDTDSVITVVPDQSIGYSVTVWNDNEKKITHNFNIQLKECGMLYVPNAFTPNADGYNDIFKAYGVAIESFRMQIMNKNGLIVFESENLNEGWDGTYDDRLMPAGVYLYRIVYTGVEGDTKTKSGTLTLIR